ncbi:SOS response-associated peptidase family protein [Luteolibacter pohnpeiensis]|uniref:Abasic site processing protein n=1 Tax=Luteolibacter pohnpeiensis TaxID=454153 RepID=A0A934SAI1_9BACT|nr:SOS response-associated peptidase family protein [Luteolibacter pohnpeiensis]MBK1884400.1 SOS response-associated peptidase family protein [Luteolibacter pohnpeiensis]
MCTAYELGKSGGRLPASVTPATIRKLSGIKETQLIRPTLSAPVILPDGSMRAMSWGFRRTFAPKVKGGKSVTRTIVNSREDKLAGQTWNVAFRENRCLIPVASYFEWSEAGGRKFPLRFQRPGQEWLWIAGIWEDHEQHGECFSMITTEPNRVVEPVHDRMPAVLADSQIEPYLEMELNEFGPSSVELEFSEAANFLKPGGTKPKPGDAIQTELF